MFFFIWDEFQMGQKNDNFLILSMQIDKNYRFATKFIDLYSRKIRLGFGLK